MANPFDQFDAAPAAPAPAATPANPFDQFDAAAAPDASAPAASPGSQVPWTVQSAVLPWLNGVARMAANSVPLVGDLADKLDAKTDAMLHGGSYDQALAAQKQKDQTFADQNPVSAGVAGFGGAAAGTVALLPEWGLGGVGSLASRVAGSTVGGATLGGADAVVRGEDPASGVLAGAAGGAAGPFIAKGAGALYRGVSGFIQGAPDGLPGTGRIASSWLQDGFKGMTPEDIAAARQTMGPGAMVMQMSPALQDYAGSIADNNGAGKPIVRNTLDAQFAGRDARVNDLVNSNLGAVTNPTDFENGLQSRINDLGDQRSDMLSNAGPIDASSVLSGLQGQQDRFAPNSPERRALARALGWVSEDAKPPATGSTWEPDLLGSGQVPAYPGSSLESRVFQQAVPAEAGHSIVPVDADKVDVLTGWQPDYRIAPGAGGPDGKLARASDFIQNLGDGQDFRPPVLGVHDQGMGIDDGRHRFAAMRDLGFRTVPVSMDPASEAAARRLGLVNETPAMGGGMPPDAPGFPATPDGFGAAPSRPGPVGVPRPVDLQGFVRSLGGIQDRGGDLAAMGYNNLIARPGQGLGADAMRQAAAQMGYLGADIDHATANTTVNDLINAIGSDNPIHSVFDENAAAQWAARDAAMADYKQRGDASSYPTARPAAPPRAPGLPFSGDPGFDPNAAPQRVALSDATQLHHAKQVLGKQVDWSSTAFADPNASVGYAEGAYKRAYGDINAALRNQVDGYGANQDAQSSLFAQQKALELGRADLAQNADPARYPETFAKTFGALPQGAPDGSLGAIQDARRVGQRFALAAALGNKANDYQTARQALQGEGGWNAANLRTVFGQAPIDNVEQGLGQEAAQAASRQRIMGGSPTGEKVQRSQLTKPGGQTEGTWGLVKDWWNDLYIDKPGSILPFGKIAGRVMDGAYQRARTEMAPHLAKSGPEADALLDALIARRQRQAALAPPAMVDPLVRAMVMGAGQYLRQ